uniref:Uncharacterized protein n=1 Tax=Pithovirus LCPAC406 TaxID=2506599 RepID=A0A481ZDI3_9VIRU|nr:MAG: uncharacterized protein LCPAC406_00300 [Pithovirus LCPAC406]
MGGNQSHDINLSDIVDCVTREEDRFDLRASERKHDIISTKKDYVDITKPLKNVATDIVVDEFFQTKDTLYNFLQYVYTIFYDTLIIYRQKRKLEECDVLFLYKGGSILRIISREFLLELPESSIREISKFYSPYFKRSDADFSIYVNPKLKNYEDVYHELGLLSYLVQNKIRYWFCGHMMKYFNFFRYNLQYQKSILKSYLCKMNEVEEFKDQFIDLKINRISAVGYSKFAYSNNADITLEFLNEKEVWTTPIRKVARSTIKHTDSIMTITHNNALDFKGETEDVRIKFNLARTKIIFTLLKKNGNTMNIGGELIDVSIGHRDDKNVAHFWEDMEGNMVTYDLNFSDECNFAFYSYSLSYLVHDLEYILFVQREMPWNDPKYIKRLNRLFYLYFIDIFVILEDGNDKFMVLKNVLELVLIPLKSSLRSWHMYINEFREKYKGEKLMIVNLMNRLEKLIPKLKSKDMDSFTEMIDVLISNAEMIIRSIMNIRTYCSTDGYISEPDLYEADIKQLL